MGLLTQGPIRAKTWQAPLAGLQSSAAYPLTLFVWAKGPDVTGGYGVIEVGSLSPLRTHVIFDSAGSLTAQSYDGTSASDATLFGFTVAGRWQARGAVWYSNASHTVFGAEASAASTGTVADFAISNIILGDSAVGPAFAEAAVWNAALTPGEMVQLQRGANPLTIQPRRLLGYYPLRGSLEDLGPSRVGLRPVGADAPVWCDHPPVALPPRRRIIAHRVAAPPPTARPFIRMVA